MRRRPDTGCGQVLFKKPKKPKKPKKAEEGP